MWICVAAVYAGQQGGFVHQVQVARASLRVFGHSGKSSKAQKKER
jgi:hypothetical protein